MAASKCLMPQQLYRQNKYFASTEYLKQPVWFKLDLLFKVFNRLQFSFEIGKIKQKMLEGRDGLKMLHLTSGRRLDWTAIRSIHSFCNPFKKMSKGYFIKDIRKILLQ